MELKTVTSKTLKSYGGEQILEGEVEHEAGRKNYVEEDGTLNPRSGQIAS